MASVRRTVELDTGETREGRGDEKRVLGTSPGERKWADSPSFLVPPGRRARFVALQVSGLAWPGLPQPAFFPELC